MLDRLLGQRIQKLKKSLLILGPRQVGKSTLCRSLKPHKIVNLADEESYLAYAKDPSQLRRELLRVREPQLILIDEIQRVPKLLNVVQAIIDENPAHRFLITGSSARKLKRGEANLLPGRIILEHLDPLYLTELGADFDLERALQVGMLPGIHTGGDEAVEVLGTYATVYLREEIQAEALARDVGSYARFLDAAALSSGQWINYSKLSSDTEIPKETIRRYMTILEETLLAFRLPAFRPRARLNRRVAQKDRYLLFDVGVRNALLGLHKRPVAPDRRGALFEEWLILQVFYLNQALKKDWTLSSYRTEGGAEVDLVIETADAVYGIEVKASRKGVGPEDLRGLRSLAEVVGRKQRYHAVVVYQGESEQTLADEVLLQPYRRFLDSLIEIV